MTSFDAGRYRQLMRPLPDSKKVETASSSTSRTLPVAGSATRSVVFLWSRDVDTNATLFESGAHCTSAQSPPRHERLSHSVERCWSGSILNRTTFAASTSMTTRWIVDTTSSPGSGYFHTCSSGWPALVLTRYISPTLRWSCRNVATCFESGDHTTIGRSLLTHPALSVAYPKSFTPSVVSAVSLPVAASRTQRFHSRMKTERLPSGEGTSFLTAPRPPPPAGGSDAAPRPPPAVQAGKSHAAFAGLTGSTMNASVPFS